MLQLKIDEDKTERVLLLCLVEPYILYLCYPVIRLIPKKYICPWEGDLNPITFLY